MAAPYYGWYVVAACVTTACLYAASLVVGLAVGNIEAPPIMNLTHRRR